MIKQLLKKVLIIYLVVIACIFTPTYRAYAASAGGWAFNSFNVATSVVTALKGGASASVAVAKSPISQKIAKGIVGGVIAGAALPLAISQISGISLSALDWVLDPANNSIKYKDKNPTNKYWAWAALPYLDSSNFDMYAATTPEAACIKLSAKYGKFDKISDLTAQSANCWWVGQSSYNQKVWLYNYTAPNDYKTIPIPTVADKIYDNAKTDTASASVVNDAVKDYVNSGAADIALDNAKADADATHGCGTGTHWSGSACVADTPSTPSTPTTPDTPFDPSSILDAIGRLFDAVMSLPDVINNALDSLLNDIKDFFQPVLDLVTDFFQWVKDTATDWKDDFVDEYKAFRDWVKSEPTPENPTKPDVTTLPTPPTDSVNISFGGGCPAPKVIAWSLAGRNIDITIPYTPICDTATLLNPLIKLAASLGAVFIIAGIRRGDDG